MLKEKGYIYILTNPAFPQYVKLGYAKNVENRLKSLNASSAVPFAFRLYATYEVNKKLTDKGLHKLIDQLNPELRTIDEVDGKKRVREFYAMSREDAYSLLESIAKISGTERKLKKIAPSSSESKDEKKANEDRQGPLKFSECNISVGAKLQFARDKSIEVEVVDDRHVEYKGEVTSLSRVAQMLLKRKYNVQGPAYFEYKGKLLVDLRK
ncbi:MAG: GIY-YIG nuclease family protein [Eubacterium sp.]|nr:GIY-YIG nuclease family protein [Eubacterium sp.]